jgi:hypothetical protein
MASQKVPKALFPSFRRKPESSLLIDLQNTWTPVFTGVTTFAVTSASILAVNLTSISGTSRRAGDEKMEYHLKILPKVF